MLFVTDAREQITVKCSCGCYSLSFWNRGPAHYGVVLCPFCGARASLPTLLRDWAPDRTRADISIEDDDFVACLAEALVRLAEQAKALGLLEAGHFLDVASLAATEAGEKASGGGLLGSGNGAPPTVFNA